MNGKKENGIDIYMFICARGREMTPLMLSVINVLNET